MANVPWAQSPPAETLGSIRKVSQITTTTQVFGAHSGNGRVSGTQRKLIQPTLEAGEEPGRPPWRHGSCTWPERSSCTITSCGRVEEGKQESTERQQCGWDSQATGRGRTASGGGGGPWKPESDVTGPPSVLTVTPQGSSGIFPHPFLALLLPPLLSRVLALSPSRAC